MTAHCSARSQHVFLFLTAVVVCCQSWPALCVFHRTLPCGVCFLRGFGAPVAVLDGGCRRHAGVECGSRGRRRQMGLAFGHKRSVSDQWYGFLPCLLKPVSNQTSQPDSGSDSNENQMVTREECEKQKKGRVREEEVISVVALEEERVRRGWRVTAKSSERRGGFALVEQQWGD